MRLLHPLEAVEQLESTLTADHTLSGTDFQASPHQSLKPGVAGNTTVQSVTLATLVAVTVLPHKLPGQTQSMRTSTGRCHLLKCGLEGHHGLPFRLRVLWAGEWPTP